MTTWRIVFMGTPAFARPALEALLARPDPIVGVVCQPDRARGRGLVVSDPEVKRVALAHGLPVLQPEKVRSPEFVEELHTLAPDLAVVAAFGRILPREILTLPTHGCINVHASLLPRHRGAAPIERSILAGDVETGVTIMRMVEELDAGDIVLQSAMPIAPEETGGTLGRALAGLGATLLGEAIDGLKAGTLRPTPQSAEGVTYAARILPDDLRIDWSRPAVEIERRVRAFAPRPAAFTTVGARRLKVHRARVEEGTPTVPGTVVRSDHAGIVVGTGDGHLRLLEVQLEGRKRLAAGAFLSGHPLPPGTCLGDA